jgi:hypothetical protein
MAEISAEGWLWKLDKNIHSVHPLVPMMPTLTFSDISYTPHFFK